MGKTMWHRGPRLALPIIFSVTSTIKYTYSKTAINIYHLCRYFRVFCMYMNLLPTQCTLLSNLSFLVNRIQSYAFCETFLTLAKKGHWDKNDEWKLHLSPPLATRYLLSEAYISKFGWFRPTLQAGFQFFKEQVFHSNNKDKPS